MHALLNTAFTAARKAAKIIIRHLDRLDTLQISEKSPNDFVSEVDLQAEKIIIDTLRQAYPSHAILSEEAGYIGRDTDEYLWIIDPLDGTQNYLHGLPHFAISIAVQYRGRLEHGLVYDPLREELFSASRGGGARMNDRRLRVSKATYLHEALLGTGFPFRHRETYPAYLSHLQTLCPAISDIRRSGCASLDLAYVAAGRLDGFWEGSLKSWDIAAGALLIIEAGGLVSDFAGQDDFLHSGNIVAANNKIFAALRQSLQDNATPRV